MKFPLSWLRQYLDTQASVEELAAKLNAIGLEVEGIENPAEKLAGFRIAKVLTADKHPQADKLRVWFKPPGWQPADLAASQPKPPFRLEQVQTFNPALTASQQWFAGLQFVLLLGGVAGYLWVADDLSFAHAAVGCVALSACVWALGRYLQNGLHALELLAVEAAALATLGALELLPYYLLTKPLVMVIAMIFVAGRAYSTWASGTFGTKSRVLLLGALLFSLAGDVFLMLPGDYFIPGLASFLVAHLFYIALFRQGQAWFPSRPALLGVLAFGAAVYAVLWSHLGHPVLQGAVAAYVSVISLMAAQALGRAVATSDRAARWVAAGACIFMLSDALIAVNKFLTPVPLASFWILLTYYCAQLLIVHHVVGPRSAPPAQA